MRRLLIWPMMVVGSTVAMCLPPTTVGAQAPPTTPPPSDADVWAEWGGAEAKSLVGVVNVAAAMRTVARTTLDEPGETAGGGDGAESACGWVAQGPLEVVAAAQAAVNAAQLPTVDDPTTEEPVVLPGGVGEIPLSTTWYRVTGTTAQVLHTEVCNGVEGRSQFFDLVPDGAGGLVVRVSAQDLVPGAFAQVVRRLPTPVPRVGPADEDEDGFAYVNTPVFFWLDRAPGQWATVSGSASAGGVSVTVQAEPVRLVVDPGDGTGPLWCAQFRPVLRDDVNNGRGPSVENIHDGCQHRYVDSSAMAPNGETWPVTASIVWHATWSASNGQGGGLGYVTTSAPVRQLPVAEIQIVVNNYVD